MSGRCAGIADKIAKMQREGNGIPGILRHCLWDFFVVWDYVIYGLELRTGFFILVIFKLFWFEDISLVPFW